MVGESVVSERLKSLVPPGRAHRSFYTDPALFELEMERIFERSWVFVAHESEIPEPGDFKTTSIGRQPVIVTRSPSLGVSVLVNRCMHRAALVCREEKGNAKRFRCFYHGWTYSSDDGRLVGVPFPDAYEDSCFDKAEYGLRSAPKVESYAGFVFASLSADVDGLEDHLGGMRRYFDLLLDTAPDGQLVVDKGRAKYLLPANWKLQTENIMDAYHAPYTHETTLRMDPATWRQPPNGVMRSFAHGHGIMDTGFPMDTVIREPVPVPTVDDAAPKADGSAKGLDLRSNITAGGLRDLSDQAKREYLDALENGRGAERAAEVTAAEGFNIFVFPNLYIQPQNQHFRVFKPKAVDETDVEAYAYRLAGAPDSWEETMLMRLNGWATALGFGQPEDVEALTCVQQGLQARSVEWLDFSRGLHREETVDGVITGKFDDETCLRGMHEEWLRLMSKEVVD